MLSGSFVTGKENTRSMAGRIEVEIELGKGRLPTYN